MHHETRSEEIASPYAACSERWERHQWSSLAIDLAADAATFTTLARSERQRLTCMFANRFHAQFNVARLLAPITPPESSVVEPPTPIRPVF